MSTTALTDHPRPAPGPRGRAALPGLRGVRRDPLGTILAHQASHGDVFAMRPPAWLPGVPSEVLYACEPDAVRTILTDTDRFVKRSPVYREMADALGDGLLTSEGGRWRAQRRTLQPLFTRRRVDGYVDAFVAATTVVADRWTRMDRVDLCAEMERVTLGSVSRALFGTDATDEVSAIVGATDELSRATVARGLAVVPLPRSWPTPTNRRLDRRRAELEERVTRIVAASSRGGARQSLVTHLHEARDPETGDPLSADEIREQAVVFLLAGYDTTSTALTFTLHLLGHHPEIQAAVRREIAEVVGDGPPTAAHAEELDLTRRCVLEGMRLHPPAWITSRTAARSGTVGGHRVDAGAVTATVFAALHRNPRVWPEPDRFDPDRFLPDAVRARDHYAYLPFGGGPRRCIGEHFAMLEATVALAVLLARFELHTTPRTIPVRLGITLRADGQVPATVAPSEVSGSS